MHGHENTGLKRHKYCFLYNCCISLHCPCPNWLEFSKKVNTNRSLIAQVLIKICCGFIYPVALWLVMETAQVFSFLWKKKNNMTWQFTWQTYFSVSGDIWIKPSGVWWIERGQEVVNPVQICPSVQNNTDPVACWCKIGLITESLKHVAPSLDTASSWRWVFLFLNISQFIHVLECVCCLITNWKGIYGGQRVL